MNRREKFIYSHAVAGILLGAACAFLSAQPAIVNPPPILHVGFANADGSWNTNDCWTNYFSFAAISTSDFSRWQTNVPTLEIFNGHLCFEVSATQAQQFFIGQFTPQ